MLTQVGISEKVAYYLNKGTSKRGAGGWGWRMEKEYLKKQHAWKCYNEIHHLCLNI